MAEVQPFRGWRYDIAQVGDLSDVTCPPYDVIDAEFQNRLYEQHPCNVVRLELNRPEPGDTSPDDRYTRASNFLKRWMAEHVLLQEREPALYVYHQVFTWEGREYTRKGFLGRIRLERFGEGKVYPHEQTLSGPKADRLALFKACQMHLSPIFGLFPDAEGAVQSPLEQAILGITPLEATDHLGVIHRLWPVTRHDVIEKVTRSLWDKPIFIADGHHRYETSITYRDWLASQGKLSGPEAAANFTMMMFVGMSDPGLVILPTHRLVKGYPGLTADDVTAALRSHLDLESVGTGPQAASDTWELIDADGSQNAFGFGTLDGTWLLGRVKDASPMQQLAPTQSDEWRSLGVSLLHKLVIEHLLGQKYPQAKPEFQYVHSLQEVNTALANKGCDLACLVPPARIAHVEDIASQLEKMPPKSTYFYPKLQTGLVFHAIS